MEHGGNKRKLRLRRVGIVSTPPSDSFVNNEIIQKNLEPLRENIEKKKRAQDAYYNNHSEEFGMSPIIRETNRQPVKHRLGRHNVSFAGTNISSMPPKPRFRKFNGTLNNTISFKTRRNNLTQQRMLKTRTMYQQTIPNHFDTKVKLERPSTASTEPTNFRVHVVNNAANRAGRYNNLFQQRPRRFRQILVTKIQMQIKRMQQQFVGFNEPPTKVTPETTVVNMNDRFARLT